MTTPPPWYSQTAAPSYPYSQLPEVSAGWSGAHAPEAVGDDTEKEASGISSGTRPPPPPGGFVPRQRAPPSPMQQQHVPVPYNVPVAYIKPEPEPSVTAVPPSERSTPSAAGAHPPSPQHHGPGPRKPSVLILSVAFGLLATAVVALAAVTGIMAKRASDAESAMASASARLAGDGTCPAATATTTAVIVAPSGTTGSDNFDLLVADVSNGCDDKDEKISGTKYTTRLFDKVQFVRHCNLEPIDFPIFGMLTQDFETCMDACASWTSKGADVIGANNLNSKCGGVRFVPAWTNRTEAYNKQARGNCFLQAGRQTRDKLKTPDLANGVTCHAGLVTTSSVEESS